MNKLTNENPLIVLPQLACVIGMEQALLLQQLHFRLQKQTMKFDDGEVWYCQTLAKWQVQLPFWNEPKIKRIIRTLEEAQIVHSTDKLNQFYVDRTKWYTIDYTQLQHVIDHYKMTHNIVDEHFAQLSVDRAAPYPKKAQKERRKPKNNGLDAQIDEILTYLNEQTAKRFSLKSQANRSYISGRLNDGYTVADCKMVIDEQVTCWLHDGDMHKYLRPMTLFRPSNFDSYLNNALTNYQPAREPKSVVLDFNAGEDY